MSTAPNSLSTFSTSDVIEAVSPTSQANPRASEEIA
jgi:hypothetical protein